jgi:hypothetical protein
MLIWKTRLQQSIATSIVYRQSCATFPPRAKASTSTGVAMTLQRKHISFDESDLELPNVRENTICSNSVR